MSGFVLRRARADDVPRIWEIRHSVRENRLEDPGKVTDAEVADTLARGLFHLAVSGGRVLGFSAAEPRDGTIWALFVDPAAEGRGLGRALLAAAVDDLAAAGWRVARLTTGPGTRAERFYGLAGWTREGPDPDGEIAFSRAI